MNATPSTHDERTGDTGHRAEAHPLVRAMNTPLGNLFRGRVTGPIHRRTAANAEELGEPPIELSADAERLVARVVKRTRLWPSEKRQVDAELRAHFADGYDAGRTTDELIETFGDPDRSAKLIRRAKIRCRPLWWQALWYTRTAFLLCVGLYILLAVYLLLGDNTPEVNYLAKLNERPRSVPEDQRAWPLYLEAGLMLKGDPFEERHAELHRLDKVSDLPHPGEPGWNAAVAYLDDHTAALDRVERAAARAQLGFVYGQEPSAAGRKHWDLREKHKRQFPYHWREEPLSAVWVPHIGTMHDLHGLMLLRARRAVHESDPAKAVRSYTAMIRVAGHVAGSFPVAQHLGVGMMRDTYDELGRVLHESPGVLETAHWRDLAHRLAGADAALRLDFTFVRYFLKDYLQRIYTDSGHVNLAGVRRLAEGLFRDYQPVPCGSDNSSGMSRGDRMLLRDALITVSLPAMAAWVAPRQKMTQKLDDLYTRMQMLTEQPLWQWDERWHDGVGAVSRFLNGSRKSILRTWRYAPLAKLMPVHTVLAYHAEHAKATRDAVLVAIALELYRRRNGDWPASLDSLTPHLLPATPPDRFTGEPMKYTLRDGQPVLYSVGVDRDDDGGRLPAGRSKKSPVAGRNAEARRWLTPDQRKKERDNGNLPDGDWILWPTLRDHPAEKE